MSLSAVLLPLAIAVCISAVETASAVKQKYANGITEELSIETRFNDAELLCRTLREHGINVQIIAEDVICAECVEGRLIYKRNSPDEAFRIYLDGISNIDELICNIEELEQEYNMNVQEYTYKNILNNLGANMRLESEAVLDDDSILLTISIDE